MAPEPTQKMVSCTWQIHGARATKIVSVWSPGYVHFYKPGICFIFIFHLVYGLIRFKHQNHMVRERSCLASKYLFWSPLQYPVTPWSCIRNIQWFHTDKCWNNASNDGHQLGNFTTIYSMLHVTWTRYDTFCRNVNTVCHPLCVRDESVVCRNVICQHYILATRL